MPNPAASFRLLLVLAGGGVFSPGAGAALRDDVQHREWLQLRAPGLDIISDLSEPKLRTWAAEIVWFRAALGSVLEIPGALPDRPATIFLFSSDRAMRPFLPVIDGKPVRVAALFSESMDTRIGAVPLGGSRFETREKLYHELTHWYLRRAGAIIPLWFEEGLAQAMESFTLQGDGFRVGAPRIDDFPRVRIAQASSLLPLLTRLELDYSRAGWKHGQTELFYAQSAALTNLLLFGAKQGRLERFGSYIRALRLGLPPERAFATGFGLSTEEARRQLEDYIRVPRWKIVTQPLDRKIDPTTWVVGPLTGDQLDRSFAALLIAHSQTTAAQAFLAPVLGRHPADVAALELKAASLVRENYATLPGDAVGALVSAYQAGSRNPWICSLLGLAALERTLTELTEGSTGRPIPSLAFFQCALERSPGFLPAYEGIASLIITETEVSRAERALLAEAQFALAGSPAVQVALAHVDVLDAKPAAARMRLEQLLREQPDLPVEVRLQLSQMVNALPEI